jgi:hypothetical protein
MAFAVYQNTFRYASEAMRSRTPLPEEMKQQDKHNAKNKM